MKQIKSRLAVMLAVMVGAFVLVGLHAAEKPKAPEGKKETTAAAAKTAVAPKPLSDKTQKGLEYLVNQQQASGGWGQGGGWRNAKDGGRVEGEKVQDPPDVASTCMATLALIRAGHTATEGKYAKNVAKAVEFICGHVEKADKDSLYVTDIRGTQVQSKIGPYVDTFLTSVVLAELKGKMPGEKGEKLLVASLDKTIGKIEKNLKADGTIAGNNAWAPIFSQALCSRGLSVAKQKGAMVKEETLARASKTALDNLDAKTGEFKTPVAKAETVTAATGKTAATRSVAGAGSSGAGGSGDAGVGLYNISNQQGQLQQAVNANRDREKKAREVFESPKASQPQKEKAKRDLDEIAALDRANDAAVGNVVRRLEDKAFIQGFGSNGGEEFLSYVNISESLALKGGEDWAKWDKSITDNLNRIQNQDGSWSGHHCITGRTFCTSTALLVLMADRTPAPAADKVKEKK